MIQSFSYGFQGLWTILGWGVLKGLSEVGELRKRLSVRYWAVLQQGDPVSSDPGRGGCSSLPGKPVAHSFRATLSQ